MTRPRLVLGALLLIPALVAGQSLVWVFSYYPHATKATFYPTNDVQAYLSSHLGHERFFGAFGAIYGSVETIHGLRQFHGHGFLEQPYGELADALPGQQFLPPPHPATIIRGELGGGAVARSPILDRAAGHRVPRAAGDDTLRRPASGHCGRCSGDAERGPSPHCAGAGDRSRAGHRRHPAHPRASPRH